ncbi:MAG: heme A synthase [Opitutales bacterium]|nr:heme A synthase [Opitutales bacterium]
MTPEDTSKEAAGHRPNLTGFAFLTLAVTLILVYAGGFTTTIGAGMVFPDWPLSNGSLNPPGWTTDEAMLAEHSHRLLGALVGLLTLTLAVWIHLREDRKWIRRLGWFAVGLVIFQGLLGGFRVLLVSLDLAKIHGVMAQLYLCTLTSLVVGLSRWWRELPRALPERAWARMRTLGLVLCAGVFVQLVVGAVMRHRGAGMAIPYFPHARSDGGWLPAAWNWATQIHFLHRVLAVVILALLIAWMITLFRSPGVTRAMKKLAVAALALVCIQIALGAEIIWSGRAPFQTTLHVLNGAVFFAVVWAGTFAAFRSVLEPEDGGRSAVRKAEGEPAAAGAELSGARAS